MGKLAGIKKAAQKASTVSNERTKNKWGKGSWNQAVETGHIHPTAVLTKKVSHSVLGSKKGKLYKKNTVASVSIGEKEHEDFDFWKTKKTHTQSIPHFKEEYHTFHTINTVKAGGVVGGAAAGAGAAGGMHHHFKGGNHKVR